MILIPTSSVLACRVCVISLLNPVTHGRLFHKEARTLAQAGYAVTVIGQGAGQKTHEQAGIRLISNGLKNRGLRERLLAQWRIGKQLTRERPDVLHLHTPELLPLAGFLRASGVVRHVIYDMHEDYAANIRCDGAYPAWQAWVLSRAVRGVEGLAAHFWLRGVVYAERSFAGRLQMAPARIAVVRNLYAAPSEPAGAAPRSSAGEMPRLLLSGTLAPAWGLWHAYHLWEALNQDVRPVRLVLAGHAPQPEPLQALLERVAAGPFAGRFELIGGWEPVPYERIAAEIEACTAGLALYEPWERFDAREPTKFFEYMHFQKPLIFTELPNWTALNRLWNFGVAVDPAQPAEAAARLRQAWEASASLGLDGSKRLIPRRVYDWPDEAPKLLRFYERVVGLPAGNASS